MLNKYKISGLDCANCANKLEAELCKIKGVKSVKVNFLTQRMSVEYDETPPSEKIQSELKLLCKRSGVTLL